VFGHALAKRTKDGITLSHAPYFTPLSEMSLSVISDNIPASGIGHSRGWHGSRF
jgi:hypothetical protein